MYIETYGTETLYLHQDKIWTRSAVVYPKVDDGLYRIRIHVHPEPQGWTGGKVLYGHDQQFQVIAFEIARDWVEDGTMPVGVF